MVLSANITVGAGAEEFIDRIPVDMALKVKSVFAEA
jgi:hypothetical protein